MWSRRLAIAWSGIGLLSACNPSSDIFHRPDAPDVVPEDGPPDAALNELAQQAYIKASNTNESDEFGYSIALSADGSTLAVSAYQEDSAAIGVGGTQADNSATDAGAVYVFTRSGTTWSQQAYVKASNTGASDAFGYSVALSGDGSTLAVGAIGEDSAATGIGGNQADNSALQAGAVYVFTRSGATWSQQAYVKASNTGASDAFGASIALSGNGSTLAVGAPHETDLNLFEGAVYVFARTGTVWSQQSYLKASNADKLDSFGTSVALSTDGSTLAVGADGEDSAATGIGGDQGNSGSTLQAGAVYVFTRSGAIWSQQAYVKASNTGADDAFGYRVALSGDGSTLAVGAYGEDSGTTGVDGNQSDNLAERAGAVYVFTRSSTAWSQQAYVKASNTDAGDELGFSVALSGDGSALAVGAVSEDSAAIGLDGNQADNSALHSGAGYVFTRSGTTWSQQAYVKASNTGADDYFGWSVALSDDGSTLAMDALDEASAASGIEGNQNDNSASHAGAVYVFH